MPLMKCCVTAVRFTFVRYTGDKDLLFQHFSGLSDDSRYTGSSVPSAP